MRLEKNFVHEAVSAGIPSEYRRWILTNPHPIAERLRELIPRCAAGPTPQDTEGCREVVRLTLLRLRQTGFQKVERAPSSQWLPIWVDTFDGKEHDALIAACGIPFKMAVEDILALAWAVSSASRPMLEPLLILPAEALYAAWRMCRPHNNDVADAQGALHAIYGFLRLCARDDDPLTRNLWHNRRSTVWEANGYSAAQIRQHDVLSRPTSEQLPS